MWLELRCPARARIKQSKKEYENRGYNRHRSILGHFPMGTSARLHRQSRPRLRQKPRQGCNLQAGGKLFDLARGITAWRNRRQEARGRFGGSLRFAVRRRIERQADKPSVVGCPELWGRQRQYKVAASFNQGQVLACH